MSWYPQEIWTYEDVRKLGFASKPIRAIILSNVHAHTRMHVCVHMHTHTHIFPLKLKFFWDELFLAPKSKLGKKKKQTHIN